jgi:hypothetical protein
MQFDIEMITTAFVVLVFLAAEVYRIARGRRATIEFIEPILGCELAGLRLRVRLDDGATVWAQSDPCTACMGHFRIGDSVRVTRFKDEFKIHLPWGLGRTVPTCKSVKSRRTDAAHKIGRRRFDALFSRETTPTTLNEGHHDIRSA